LKFFELGSTRVTIHVTQLF